MCILDWYKKRKAKIEQQLQDNVKQSDEEMILKAFKEDKKAFKEDKKAFKEDKKALYSDWKHIGNDFPIGSRK